MAKFYIELNGITSDYAIIEVEANSSKEALEKAKADDNRIGMLFDDSIIEVDYDNIAIYSGYVDEAITSKVRMKID